VAEVLAAADRVLTVAGETVGACPRYGPGARPRKRLTEAVALERRRELHRRALWLEYFTVGWNVIEGVVAIGAGLVAGSVALVGFGVDSSIEVISALGLLWRLRKAGPEATVAEESGAERRALYVVAATFFLLAAYIAFEAVTSLIGREEPDRSAVGLVLSVLSLVIMLALAWWKQRTGREMGSRAVAMLPVILWQGWETLGEAREQDEDDEDLTDR
jgi:Co/Zn/Cd efflux system component